MRPRWGKSWHSRPVQSYNHGLPPADGTTSPERKGSLGQMKRVIFSLSISLLCTAALAADLEEAEKLFRTGRYEECAEVVDRGLANNLAQIRGGT